MLTPILVAPITTMASTEVPVASRGLDRGSLISADDISMRALEANRLPRGAILNKNDIVGLEALRNIRSGSPIRSQHVRIPPLTRQGQDVTLIVRHPGLELQTSGRALEDGNKGDAIKVMNDASKEVIEAVVIGAGHLIVQQ